MRLIKTFDQFIESLIFSKYKVYNTKKISKKVKYFIKTDYVNLKNDNELYQFFLKKNNKFSLYPSFQYLKNKYRKKKIKFNFISLHYLKYFLKNLNIIIFLRFFLIKILFSNDNFNKYKIIIYVDKYKHFIYFEKLFKNSKIEYCYFSLSPKLLKVIKKKKKKILNFKVNNLNFNFKSNPFNNYISASKIFESVLKNENTKILLGAEGDDAVFEIFCQIAKKYNVKTVCLQWGCFVYKKPKLSMRYSSLDYFLSWGEYFSQQLKLYSVKTNFLNIGRPNFCKKNRKKKNILTLLTASPSIEVTKNHWEKLFILINNLAKLNKGWKFVIRGHPNYNIEKFKLDNFITEKNIFIEEPYKVSIDDSLSLSKIALGIDSSALIEAIGFKCIPISFRPNKNVKLALNLNKKKIGFSSSNIDEIQNKIKYLINNKNLNYLKNISHIKKFLFKKIDKNINPQILKIINNLSK